MTTANAEDSGVHAPPETPGVTRDELVDILRAESILGERLAPLPGDIEAEREIVGAILAEQIDRNELAPLESKHFLSALLGAAFDVLEQPFESSDHLAVALAGDFGRQAWNIVEELGIAAVITTATARQRAEHVVELWRRRRLVVALRGLEAALCAGAIPFEVAVEQLRNTILEVRV